jgi:hypothetical protein
VNPANEGQGKQGNTCEHHDKEQQGKEVGGETYIHGLYRYGAPEMPPDAETRWPADVMTGHAGISRRRMSISGGRDSL